MTRFVWNWYEIGTDKPCIYTRPGSSSLDRLSYLLTNRFTSEGDPVWNCTGFVQLKENLENLEKGTFWKTIRENLENSEFSDHFYNLRENSGNFILANVFDQIGCALRINESINKW